MSSKRYKGNYWLLTLVYMVPIKSKFPDFPVRVGTLVKPTETKPQVKILVLMLSETIKSDSGEYHFITNKNAFQ